MKILYHHRTQGKSVEGVHIWSIVKSLKAQGHDVDVMSLLGLEDGPPNDQGGASAQNIQAEESSRSVVRNLAKLVSRHAPELLFELFELAYNFVILFRFRSYFKNGKPDFVYERYALFMFLSIWLCKIKGIPVIVEVNDSAVVERVRPLFLKKLAARIERWVFKNCSGLVFISNEFLKISQAAHGDIAPSVISPNAADISIFSPDNYGRDSIRSELGLGDSIVCGYVGAFVEWHGIGRFVRKIAGPIADSEKLVLLLVGDGQQYPEIKLFIEEKGLQNKIKLTGRVNHEEVSRLISAMDFAVLPDSNEYGSPMKMFEHMAMGVAMVAPDYSPIEEVITNNKTGWIFGRGNLDMCVERVLNVGESEQLQKKVGENARRHIVENHQWDNNVRQLLLLYKDVTHSCIAST